MLAALTALGLLLLALGFAGLVRPNAIQRSVAAMAPNPRYALAVGVRLALGLFLVAAAHEARWPGATRVFGYLVLAAAFAILVAGPTRLANVVRWWAAKPPGVVRLASSAAIAIGVLLVVDAL